MQFWYNLLSSPIVLISAILMGSFGEISKRAINSKKIEEEVVAYRDRDIVSGVPAPRAPELWKRVYYFSLPSHPVLIGVALGFVPWLPVAESLTKEGYDLAGRIGTYVVAGVYCKVGYDTFISTAKRMVRTKASEMAPTKASKNDESVPSPTPTSPTDLDSEDSNSESV